MNNKFKCKKYNNGSYIETKGYAEEQTVCNTSKYVQFAEAKNVNNYFKFPRKDIGFRAGDILATKRGPNLQKNNRKGIGNRQLNRINFIAPKIKGRVLTSFNKLEAMDIKYNGSKVQLSKNMLDKLFKIEVGDNQDEDWILEKNRRLANGETLDSINLNPPFGRPQRTIFKNVNLAMQGLNLNEKLSAISRVLLTENIQNPEQKPIVAGHLLGIVKDEEFTIKLNDDQIELLVNSIGRLRISANHQEALPELPRIINRKFFNEHTGNIVLFLLSNIPDGSYINYPILTYDKQKMKYIKSKISPVFILKKDRYIDLKKRSIDSIESLALKSLTPPHDDDSYNNYLREIKDKNIENGDIYNNNNNSDDEYDIKEVEKGDDEGVESNNEGDDGDEDTVTDNELFEELLEDSADELTESD